MKKLFFLQGENPLTKQYALDPESGALIKTSYPAVRNFTSFEAPYSTLEELAALIEVHGRQGHCLFKGELTRPLHNESRAGLYHKELPTVLACLDLDGAPFNTPDDFMAGIGHPNTSYIVQWSASAGLENKPGLRCHIFTLLTTPASPGLTKQWLQHLNHSVPALRNALDLTASGVALRYALDITTMQNDKLIYISPPALGVGITDPFPGNRVQVVRKSEETLTIGRVPTAEVLKTEHLKIINDLRQRAGLPERKKYEFKEAGTIEYLRSPGAATVTGQKADRGFVYFNLNGGDSWGYYHPLDNPAFIYNFKGEPTYKTSELLPEYWASVKEATEEYKPNEQGTTHLAFRDLHSSKFKIGVVSSRPGQVGTNEVRSGARNDSSLSKTHTEQHIIQEVTLYPCDSERQLRHWMQEQGRVIGELIPTWECYYDPNSATVINPVAQKLNIFKPSEYMSQPVDRSQKVCPPNIERLFRSVLGDPEPALLHHWLNWLAGLAQKRKALGTGWLFHGIPGTGKGLMFQLLTRMLGAQNTTLKRLDELDSEFNAWMEAKLLVLVDEMNTDSIEHGSQVMGRLKSCITEPVLSIRRMRCDPYLVDNYTNWLFASNMPNPIEVAPDDRRFNVGNYQRTALRITEAEVTALFDEIPALYSFLMNFKVDEQALRRPLQTDARSELIEKNRIAADLIGEAITSGDLTYLWEQMPDKVVKSWETSHISRIDDQRAKYAELVTRLVMELPEQLTRDELLTLFAGCTDKTPETPAKFTRFAHHHNVVIKPLWVDGRSTRGVKVVWQYDADWLARTQKWVQDQKQAPHLQAVKV